MRNQEVIAAFLRGKPGKSGSLTAEEGGALLTYSTLLAYQDRDRGLVYVNPNRYSPTSSTHRNTLVREIGPRRPEHDEDISMRRPYSFYEPVTFHAYQLSK